MRFRAFVAISLLALFSSSLAVNAVPGGAASALAVVTDGGRLASIAGDEAQRRSRITVRYGKASVS